MLEDLQMPRPAILSEMVHKANESKGFSSDEYRWLYNILVTLQHDPMYKLRERMRQYEVAATERLAQEAREAREIRMKGKVL